MLFGPGPAHLVTLFTFSDLFGYSSNNDTENILTGPFINFGIYGTVPIKTGSPFVAECCLNKDRILLSSPKFSFELGNLYTFIFDDFCHHLSFSCYPLFVWFDFITESFRRQRIRCIFDFVCRFQIAAP